MLDIEEGDNLMIYDGHDNPNLVVYNQEGLTPGFYYAFTVVAFNFNGQGDVSE
jgi:hypothetical protein